MTVKEFIESGGIVEVNGTIVNPNDFGKVDILSDLNVFMTDPKPRFYPVLNQENNFH